MIESSRYLIPVLFIIFLNGCSSTFDKVEIIENGEWHYKDTVRFNFEVQDTISPNNFFLIIRNNNNYEYNNFIAFVELEFPNGKMRRDTVELRLASNSGKWLGSGVGDVFTNEQIFISKSILPIPGNYSVNVIHAMRDELLLGVNDVGLSVRKEPV